MDFVFGTLATDKLRLLHHTLARTGIQHMNRITPLDPAPGEAITLHLITGQDFPAKHAACYFTTDGTEPNGSKGTATNGSVATFTQTDITWDTPGWNFARHWQATIPGQPDNTLVRYRISAWTDDGTEAYADWPEVQSTSEHAALAFFRGEEDFDMPAIGEATGHPFSLHVDTFAPPQWAVDAIIYQVFVDRFYPGDGRDWLEAATLSDFYGGTLWGVRDKLDYIADLGATCIWLSPIFVSPTHHGYDAIDYKKIDPRYGGDAALRAVIDGAHERGIRVLLDLACNHCSNEHPYFLDALQNPASQYRDWFTFDDSDLGYKAFFNVATMPQINFQNADARAWMYDIAQYWLREFDADGYRLDYAHGPGQDFWPGFRAACRAVKPDCFMFGEVVEAPDVQKTYTGRLDGLLSFATEDAIRKTYAHGMMSEDEFEQFITANNIFYPADFITPTFIDNHDMDRFLFIAKGDKTQLMRAAEAQFRLPGPPIIYYGTEVGVSQQLGKDEGAGLEESRQPMLWGASQDKELHVFYKQLIQRRKTNH